jgi:hypothetical protein
VGFLGVKLAKDRLDQTLVLVRQLCFMRRSWPRAQSPATSPRMSSIG